ARIQSARTEILHTFLGRASHGGGRTQCPLACHRNSYKGCRARPRCRRKIRASFVHWARERRESESISPRPLFAASKRRAEATSQSREDWGPSAESPPGFRCGRSRPRNSF